MSTPIWILLVLATAAVSALMAFSYARRGAPTRRQLQELEQQLDTARGEAAQVQGKVTDHFETSALLFGQLAKDYKAFLDHYSDSAQALGLSEHRARELLEQGYQPLLTHLEQEPVAESAAAAGAPEGALSDDVDSVGAVEVEAEPPLMVDVVEEPAAEPAAEPTAEPAAEPAQIPEVSKVVDVELPSDTAGQDKANQQRFG